MGLSPDLVIGYSGNEEALAPVTGGGRPVIIFNPATLDGIYAEHHHCRRGHGQHRPGSRPGGVASRPRSRSITDAALATGSAPKVFYAVDNTLWTAGPGSFVDELLKLVNAVNVGSMQGADGAAAQAVLPVRPRAAVAADPDVILLPEHAPTRPSTSSRRIRASPT